MMSLQQAGMSAAGALRQRSGQKPRPEIAFGNFTNERLAADNGALSAEIAGSNFSHINEVRPGTDSRT
jgi:hypothetical protein